MRILADAHHYMRKWVVRAFRWTHCVAALCLVSGPASASGSASQSEAIELRYEVESAHACPDETAFRDAVVARLGFDPFITETQPDPSGRVYVTIDMDGGQWSAALELDLPSTSPPAERQVQSNECDELVAAAAVIVSVALTDALEHAREPIPPAPEPRHTTRASTSAQGPPHVDAERPPALARPPSNDPREQAATRSGPALWLNASAAVEFWQQPDPALGGMLGLELQFDWFSVRLDGHVAGLVRSANLNGETIHTVLSSGGLSACAVWKIRHPASLQSCLGARLGAFQVDGTALTEDAFGATLFAAADVRAALHLSIAPRIELSIGAHALVPFTRTVIVVRAVDAWVAPGASLSVLLGLRARLI